MAATAAELVFVAAAVELVFVATADVVFLVAAADDVFVAVAGAATDGPFVGEVVGGKAVEQSWRSTAHRRRKLMLSRRLRFATGAAASSSEVHLPAEDGFAGSERKQSR